MSELVARSRTQPPTHTHAQVRAQTHTRDDARVARRDKESIRARLESARERGCGRVPGIFICCAEMNRTGSAGIKINETDGTRAF